MTRSYKATKRNTAGDFRMEIMVVTGPFIGNLRQPDVTTLLLDCWVNKGYHVGLVLWSSRWNIMLFIFLFMANLCSLFSSFQQMLI